MRWFFAFLFVTSVAFAQSERPTLNVSPTPQQSNSSGGPQQTSPDQRGTEQSPLFVKTIQPPKSPEESRQDAKDRNDKAELERETIWLSALTLLVLALQLGAFVYQGMKLRETVAAMAGQSVDMKKSVTESARAATAMEAVAEHIERSATAAVESVELTRQRSSQQMRAYVTVVIGNGWYQDRANNIKFGVLPSTINTGLTPAQNLRYRAKADIFAFPLPPHVQFNLPDDLPWSEAGVLGPRHDFVLNAAVDNFVPDAEVNAIKEGHGRRVYIWGVVEYRDVFGETHETEFSQSIMWLPDGTVFGNYHGRRNQAT